MMEPLSVAVHAVATKGQCRANMNVLIMGAGPVGLLAMGVAKGMGAKTIVAVDINEERLNFAANYAATHTYIPVRSHLLGPRSSYSLWSNWSPGLMGRQNPKRTSPDLNTPYAPPRTYYFNVVSQQEVRDLST